MADSIVCACKFHGWYPEISEAIEFQKMAKLFDTRENKKVNNQEPKKNQKYMVVSLVNGFFGAPGPGWKRDLSLVVVCLSLYQWIGLREN